MRLRFRSYVGNDFGYLKTLCTTQNGFGLWGGYSVGDSLRTKPPAVECPLALASIPMRVGLPANREPPTAEVRDKSS